LSTARLREAFNSARVYSVWSLFLWSGNNIDRLVVAKLSTVVELGLYVRAMNVLHMAHGLTGTGSFRVLFSTFSRMQDDLPRLRAAVQRALTAGLTISGLVAAFAVVFADLLAWIILGPQWVGAIPILQIIFLSLIASSGYHFAEAVPASLGLARANAVRQALRTLLIGICAWIGAQYGIVGAAVGVAAAFWIFYVLILIYVARLISLPLATALRINVIPLIIAVVPAGAAFMVRQIPSGPQWLLDLAAVGLFGVLAFAFLALAPASIIGEDAVRLRDKLLSIVRKRGRGRKVSGT
jgi:PST family polysaccharide transporter